jgi:hypothetical protein
MMRFKKHFSPKTFEEVIKSEQVGFLGVVLSFLITGFYLFILLIKYGAVIYLRHKFLFYWLLVQGMGCFYISFNSFNFRIALKKAQDLVFVARLKMMFYKIWLISFAVPFFAMILWLAYIHEFFDMLMMLFLLVLCFVLLYFLDWRIFKKHATELTKGDV